MAAPFPDTPDAERQDHSLRHSLRCIHLAWVFGAVWLYTTTGAVLTRFAQALHLPEYGFGLLAALPSAGALIQLPTSLFLERFGHHKTVFIGVGILHRLMWLLIAAIPYTVQAAHQSTLFLGLVLLAATLGHVCTPVWITWMADLVPHRIRGRYFSRRTQTGQVVGLILTLILGYVLDHSSLLGPPALLRTLTLALAVAALFGALDFASFAPVPAPRFGAPDRKISLTSLIRSPLSDSGFRRFIGFTGTLTFATVFVGQYIWLYLFDVIGMSNTRANVLVLIVPLIISMLSYPVWGKLIDRLGRRPVLITATLLVVQGGLGWIFITPDHWVLGYVLVLIAAVAWSGIDLGNFNMLLSMIEDRGEHRYASAYVALNSLVAAVSGVLSGVFGGILAHLMAGWHGTIFGWPLTYHGVLLLISTGLRLMAIPWLFTLVDRRAVSARDSLRYMGNNIQMQAISIIFLPIRLMGRIGRWTYRVTTQH